MRQIILMSLLIGVTAPALAQAPLTPFQSLGRDLLRELVETNTTYSAGSTTKAAELLAARFRAAGFPAADVQIVGPDSGPDAKDRNLVVRFRGSGRPGCGPSHPARCRGRRFVRRPRGSRRRESGRRGARQLWLYCQRNM